MIHHKRSLSACLLVIGASLVAAQSSPDDTTRKLERRKALDRPRRILFNNDGGEPTIEMKVATKQAFLDCRTTKLAGTHVDSIFYCSRSSGFGVFTHFTKVGQVFTCTEGRYAGNQMAALLKAGLDPLAMQVEFAHQHNIELFWSMRMNDTHDGSKTDYGPILFRDNVLKNAHPEYLIGTKDKPPKYGAWSAVDYARPEIRDLAYRYVEEVCRNYDIDGIELDFFRHPVFFKSTAQGVAATPRERDEMTALVARIRTLCDTVGRMRGRPILIAIKLPDSVEYCHDIGLDLEAWLKRDLLDMLIPGGYFQLNDWETSIALAHKYGVKVYPSLDEPRLRDTASNASRLTEAAYRGRAAAAWHAGGDGIYLFNFFSTASPLLRELGDPKLLAQRDRRYFASPRGVAKAAGGNLPYEKHQTIETLNPGNPRALVAGKPVTARVAIGVSHPNSNDEITLRIRLNEQAERVLPAAKWDDRPIVLGRGADQWYEARLATTEIGPGFHRVTLIPDAGTPKSASWSDLVVEIRVPTAGAKLDPPASNERPGSDRPPSRDTNVVPAAKDGAAGVPTTYFPPTDAAGGWRTAKSADEVRRLAGLDLGKLDLAFAAAEGSTRNGGLLVVRNGWLAYERYFGLGHRDATPNLASCGKSVTSVAVGILMAERPELFPDGLDQRIFTPTYMPPEVFPLSDPAKAQIKLGQLLAFTAGIRGNNPCRVLGQETTISPAGPDGATSLNDAVAAGQRPGGATSAATLWCKPGEGYSYASASAHLASMMVRHVSGKELEDYVRERLATPTGWGRFTFGYKNSKSVTHTPGGGGIAVRGTDMLRFGYLMLREGRWGEKQIVPAAYTRHCGTASPYNPHAPYSLQFDVNAGGQWANVPRDAFWKAGSGGHMLYVVPSLDLVVWKLAGRDGQYQEADTGVPLDPAAVKAAGARRDWKATLGERDGQRVVLERVVEAVIDEGRGKGSR